MYILLLLSCTCVHSSTFIMYKTDVHTSTLILYRCTFFYFYHVQVYILLLLSYTGVHSSTLNHIQIYIFFYVLPLLCTDVQGSQKKLRIRVYQTRLIIGFSRLRPFFKSYTISDSMSSMLGL